MMIKNFGLIVGFAIICMSCSEKVNYSSDFMEQTSGRYLYSPDEVLVVYYEDNSLYLKWRGVERLRPVVMDQNTFFVADMYKKLRFTQHPETNEFYLASLDPEDEDQLSYDYPKLADSVLIPSTHLKNRDFDKALAGYLKIKEMDSTSIWINESEFNRLGYSYLRKGEFQDAIEVFKINVALYPGSSNVYDSLAEAYTRSGDSLQAFNYYTKALELDNGNRRAKKYLEAYNSN